MLVILRGFVAGCLLSAARAPLGIDGFQWAAVEGRVSYGWRSAALAAVAIGILLARQATLPVRFLLAGALGFGAHALLLANAWSPSGPVSLGVTVVLGVALLAIPGRRDRDVEAETEAGPARYLELVGLAGASAGCAIALEGVARHVRLLGGALAQDDSVFAGVLFLLVAAGGLTFGWIAGARGLRGVASPVGLAAAAAATFVSLAVVQRLALPDSYRAYLEDFRLDPTFRGTLGYDALIGAAAFVAPGLLLGAALFGARGAKRIFAILLGAALGLSLLPGILELAPGSTNADAQPSSTELVPLGGLIACGGAVLAILPLAGRSAVARWSATAAVLALGAPALLVPVKPIHVLSPWALRRTYPLIVLDTPEGLLSVESFGLLGGSWTFATLDRRTLSPAVEQIAADAIVLRGSFELLPAARKAAGKLRVLLIGQLTPERARTLAACGAVRVDRTAAWNEAMERVEEVMWSQVPFELAKPEGSILAFAEARRRIAAAEYDLVIALPAPGDAPRTGVFDAPASTTVVRWIGLDEPAVARDLGETVALTSDGFDFPVLGLLTNASPVEGEGNWAPLLVRAGEPVSAPTPIAWILRRKAERGDARTDAARGAMMARLARAAAGGDRAELVAGLATLHASQERSSQFETPEERLELPAESLARFRAAALAGPPGPYLRRVWETLARVLVRKRWIEEIYSYLEPVAKAHAPWPALEIALARADLESLAPDDAAARLERIAALGPANFEVFDLLGRAHCARGDGAKALEAWKRAAAVQPPPDYDVQARKRVLVAVARAGDPGGLAAARSFLMEHPEDEQIQAILGQPIGSGPPVDPCSP